ncbi:DUF2285 domain-containing protein [Sphingomonas canadensis]|uniref:DUF2285 domain-containing protein n=1 Tax=Sphingomonas canadensis TaxID=1219257 RepID=A0ABW3H0X6_9SPHN|nr:DUF2285 domain-containing protein [Sphingomonas canadensis]MCW3835016.1 DUF2285 domain-containing protein [Sphingomonas canadensis]
MAASPAHATDWRDAAGYGFLLEADRRIFAWEWLRRSAAYRRAWRRYGAEPEGRVALRVARRFGLAALEDPSLDARSARPVWRAKCDPHVVPATASGGSFPRCEGFDILRFATFASVAIDAEGNEHWLLSDGCRLLRIDIVEGTLLGGPALLRYRLEGLSSLPPRLESLGHLVELGSDGAAARLPRRPERRASRWIAELRAADALGQGASQRQIAEQLFGEAASSGWRLDSDAYRLRVQRLVRSARAHLQQPLAREWFTP